MAFTIYRPQAVGGANKLEDGQASITRAGGLSLTIATADSLGLRGRVVVLTDRETRRLGLRPPADEEEPTLVLRTVESGGAAKRKGVKAPPRCLRIGIRGALRSMGLDPKKIAGRREIQRKGTLAFIQLAPPPGVRS